MAMLVLHHGINLTRIFVVQKGDVSRFDITNGASNDNVFFEILILT